MFTLVTGWFNRRRKEDQDSHRVSRDAVDREMTEHTRRIETERLRTDVLERTRASDIGRIVKLETNMTNIEKSRERIEAAVEKNHIKAMANQRTLFDQLSTSIRENRNVTGK